MYDNTKDIFFAPHNILEIIFFKFIKYKERRQQGPNEFLNHLRDFIFYILFFRYYIYLN